MQPSAAATPTPEGGWSQSERVRIIAAAVASVAVVITLSVWTPWAATASDDLAARPATAVAPATPSSTVAPATPSTTPPATAVVEPLDSTTTTLPTEPDFFDSYSDAERGFSIAYPAAWRNTDPEEVGQRVYGGRNQAEERAWEDAYVAAAFADWSGPTYDGCFLTYIWVEVHDDVATDASEMPGIRANMKQTLEEWELLYPEVEIVDRFRDLQVGTASGFSVVWSVYLGKQTLVMRECALLSEGILYYLQFASTEEDWEKYDPMYRDILKEMTFRGSSPVI